MTSPLRARFAEVVRSEPVDVGLACLLVGGEVERDLDVDASLARLDALAADLPAAPSSPSAAAASLREVLGEFAGSPEDYGDVRSSLLHEVLRRRRGLPLLLSVVWTEVAARRGIPAYCVGLPGHVVVGIGDPDDQHVHVDAFAGGRVLDVEELDRIVRGATGGPLLPEHLRPLPPVELLLRLLTNVRALTGRMPPSLDAARMRLWAVELSLLLPRHPLELRRERGELLVRLGDHIGGAVELERYAALVEDADDATATAVRRQARQARARLN